VRELLSDIAIQRELGSLDGWSRKGSALAKTFQFRSFPDAVGFVNRVAELAERANHHPDIDIRFNRVICNLTTHDAGGITQNDLDLARAMDGVENEP
jgi:4a-hydroxytetrahydrobiopterin dehydratase